MHYLFHFLSSAALSNLFERYTLGHAQSPTLFAPSLDWAPTAFRRAGRIMVPVERADMEKAGMWRLAVPRSSLLPLTDLRRVPVPTTSRRQLSKRLRVLSGLGVDLTGWAVLVGTYSMADVVIDMFSADGWCRIAHARWDSWTKRVTLTPRTTPPRTRAASD